MFADLSGDDVESTGSAGQEEGELTDLCEAERQDPGGGAAVAGEHTQDTQSKKKLCAERRGRGEGEERERRGRGRGEGEERERRGRGEGEGEERERRGRGRGRGRGEGEERERRGREEGILVGRQEGYIKLHSSSC